MNPPTTMAYSFSQVELASDLPATGHRSKPGCLPAAPSTHFWPRGPALDLTLCAFEDVRRESLSGGLTRS